MTIQKKMCVCAREREKRKNSNIIMKKQPKTYEQNYVFQPNYECDVQGYPKKKKTYNNITKMRQDSITQLRTTQKN